jgi:acyl-CoA thioester hydrolase
LKRGPSIDNKNHGRKKMAQSPPFKPQDYPHAFTKEVYLYETDAFGHANNVSFVAYMESARFDLFKTLDLFDPHNVLTLPLILARLECDYEEIARYNDTLTIYSRIGEISSSSFVIDHVFVRESDNIIVAEGNVVLVYFDHEKNHSMPITEEIRQKLQEYQTMIDTSL